MEMKTTINIPVALVAFNRLDCAQASIKAIRGAAPPRLYVLSDGPRDYIQDEDEKVYAVRQYIEENVDWNCEIIKVYSKENQGTRKTFVNGFNEVFKREEMAILLEDDSIGSPSFFTYCEYMLNHYKDDERIMLVTGQNRVPTYKTDKDYLFSVIPSKYVWGTWRRAWFQTQTVLSGKFDYKGTSVYCKGAMKTRIFRYYDAKLMRFKMGLMDEWDSVWDCAILINHGLGVVSKYNMCNYLGANRADSAHMTGDAEIAHLPVEDYTEQITIRNEQPFQDREYDLIQQEHIVDKENTKYFFWIRSKIAYFTYCHFKPLYKIVSRWFR